MIWFFNLVEKVKSKFFRKKSVSEQNLLLLIVYLMLIISLLPLLVAGFYNHMSGDDWYNAKFVHEQAIASTFSLKQLFADIWGDLVDLYSRWSFTYTGYFICYLMPAGFGEEYTWLHTCILLPFTVICMYFFLTNVFKLLLEVTKKEAASGACLALLVMIQYIPSPFDAFYWWSGAANNIVGFVISIYGMIFLIKLYKNSTSVKAHMWVLFGFVLFLITGTSWAAVLVLFCSMLLGLIDMWMDKRRSGKQRTAYSICFVFFIACILFTATAPGNARRAMSLRNSGTDGLSPVIAILRAYFEGLKLLYQSINPILILMILLLCLLFLPALISKGHRFKHPVAMLAVSYSIFITSFVPTLYAEGIAGEGRVRNIQYWYAILFLLVNAFYSLGWYLQKKGIGSEPDSLRRYKTEILFIGIALCAFLMLKGENREPATKTALYGLENGTLQQFDREVDARELLLRESPEDGDLWVAGLTVIPDIFEGYTDLQPDEERFWVNNNVREYYHLKSLHVE